MSETAEGSAAAPNLPLRKKQKTKKTQQEFEKGLAELQRLKGLGKTHWWQWCEIVVERDRDGQIRQFAT